MDPKNKSYIKLCSITHIHHSKKLQRNFVPADKKFVMLFYTLVNSQNMFFIFASIKKCTNVVRLYS